MSSPPTSAVLSRRELGGCSPRATSSRRGERALLDSGEARRGAEPNRDRHRTRLPFASPPRGPATTHGFPRQRPCARGRVVPSRSLRREGAATTRSGRRQWRPFATCAARPDGLNSVPPRASSRRSVTSSNRSGPRVRGRARPPTSSSPGSATMSASVAAPREPSTLSGKGSRRQPPRRSERADRGGPPNEPDPAAFGAVVARPATGRETSPAP